MSSVHGHQEHKRQIMRDKRRKLVMSWIGDNIITIAEVCSAFPDIPKEDVSGLIRGMTLCKPRILDSYPSKQRDKCNRPITCYCKAGRDVWGSDMIFAPKVKKEVKVPCFLLGAVWGDSIHEIGKPSFVRIAK